MSVTQDYNLATIADDLNALYKRLCNAELQAIAQRDNKAAEEICCAKSNISSALVALECAA